MESKGYKVFNILVFFEIVQVDENLLSKLNISLEENVWEIKRVRLVNDVRVLYMIIYMLVKLFLNLNKIYCENFFYNFVEEVCGYKIVMLEREV